VTLLCGGRGLVFVSIKSDLHSGSDGQIGEKGPVETPAADDANWLCGRLGVPNGTIRKEAQGRASIWQVFGF
jgi:hypothetical protein